MTDPAAPTVKGFEDFEVGFEHEYIVPGLSVKAITDFASLYDPQRFHLDEEAASKTFFGSLVASGFQTQLSCFVPFCKEVLLDSLSVGSPGIDKLTWVRPWYPETPLDVKVRLVEKRMSSKRNDRGYLIFELEADAGETRILEMGWMVIMMTRDSQGSV